MLFLHIGRAKAGSSTIQHFMFHHQAFLREHGVHPALGPRPNKARPTRVARLFRGRTGAAEVDLEAFRQDVRRATTSDVVISSEIFFEIEPEPLVDLRRTIGEAPVRILIYLRDYCSWLPSYYSQKAKHGEDLADFDVYSRRQSGAVSALPTIRRWGEAFGWSNLSIRNLDPVDLAGGDLVPDLCAQLGIAAAPPPVAKLWPAPPWWMLEFTRALFKAIAAEPKPQRGRLRQEALALVNGLSAWADTDGAPSCPPAQYPTAEQLRVLSQVYASDLSVLRDLTGCALRYGAMPVTDRPFLPGVQHLPGHVRTALRDALPGDLSIRLRDLALRQLAA